MKKKFKFSKRNETGFQIAYNIIAVLLCIVFIAPLVLVVTTSLSGEEAIFEHGYRFLIDKIDLTAYKFVLSSGEVILRAYGVTFAFSILAMILGVVLMSMLAYPLSRVITPGRSVVSFLLYFTMLFSGGLVPTYILITQYLHLGNTFWVYVIPGMISPWYVFMIRTTFQGLPSSIVESAYIDGASEFLIWAKLIMPLSKPVLATVALFTFLNKWNDWYTCMLYIEDDKLLSLQYLMQRITMDLQLLKESEYARAMNAVDIPGEGARMAMAVVVAGPALFIFPFFQKYFTKGMTVGSVKG